MIAIEEHKAKAVKSALKGLQVIYLRHRSDGYVTPNMARVNGYSVIWHEYSFGYGKRNIVEVRMLDGDCQQVNISKLRELVS